MALGTLGSTGCPMAEINMIPLIDVMLVLLVIFIVTAPLFTQSNSNSRRPPASPTSARWIASK